MTTELFGGEVTPRPQTGAIVPQSPNTQDAAAQQAPEHRDAAADAQVDVQRVREDDGARGQGGAGQVVGGEQAGGVLRVCEREVHEYALESGVSSQC